MGERSWGGMAMAWLELTVSTVSGSIEDVAAALTAAGYEQNAAAKAMQALYDSLVL